MKKRLAFAVLLGVVFAASFAAVAWGTKVGYGFAGDVFQPGVGERSGWTGLGWTENYMEWTDPDGGTPNMCSNYLDTSYNKLFAMDKCSGSHLVDDTRYQSSYAAAFCWASNSNNYPVKLKDIYDSGGNSYGCWATHN